MNSINISKNITDLRKKAGVTQEQLATALNISSQAVSKWETNACQPDIMTLPLITDYFHVSISITQSIYRIESCFNAFSERTLFFIQKAPDKSGAFCFYTIIKNKKIQKLKTIFQPLKSYFNQFI